jgi:hypothetical protein
MGRFLVDILVLTLKSNGRTAELRAEKGSRQDTNGALGVDVQKAQNRFSASTVFRLGTAVAKNVKKMGKPKTGWIDVGRIC